MIVRGCFLLAILANSVFSHPVSSDVVGKEDLKVMNCIVELIANALSKPQPTAVSQRCLDVLMQDETIASILRHQNLLRELQEVAAQGASERSHEQLPIEGDGEASEVVGAPAAHLDVWPAADQSMLVGLGQRPSEGTHGKEGRANEQQGDGLQRRAESQEDNMSERNVDVHEDEEEREVHKGAQEEESEEEEEEEKRGITEGADRSPSVGGKSKSEERNNDPVDKGYDDNSAMDLEEKLTEKKRHAEGERGVMEGEEKGQKTKVTKEDPQPRSKEEGESREDEEEEAEEDEAKRENTTTEASLPQGGWEAQGIPEAQQRHLVAQEEMEEGSASRKTEDNDIERLAAIESELGSLAQRLHQLQRG